MSVGKTQTLSSQNAPVVVTDSAIVCPYDLFGTIQGSDLTETKG